MGMGRNLDNRAARTGQPSGFERWWSGIKDIKVSRRPLVKGAVGLAALGILPELALVGCAKNERAADQTLHTVPEQIALMEGLRGQSAAAAVLLYPKPRAGEQPNPLAYGHGGLINLTVNGRDQMQVVSAQHVIDGIRRFGSDTMIAVFPGTVSADPGAPSTPYQIEIPLQTPGVQLSQDFLMNSSTGNTDHIVGYEVNYTATDPLGQAIENGGITPLTLRTDSVAHYQRLSMVDPDGNVVSLEQPSDQVFPTLLEFQIRGNTGRTCVGDSGKPIVVEGTGEVYGILNAVAAQQVDQNQQNFCGLRGGFMIFGGPALVN